MKRSFHIVPNSPAVLERDDANFDDVVQALSSNPDWHSSLKVFTMHSWRPGRWMHCEFGKIYCVDKEIK